MTRHFGGMGTGHQQDRNRLLIVLALCLFFIIVAGFIYLFATRGGGASVATSVVVQKEQVELKMVDVLVPIQKIESGTVLEPVLFRVEQRPDVGLSSRVVKGFDQIKGYFARSMIVPGEPLISDLITPVRPTNAITASIPEGYRAVTINVNATSSVEGWALPGAKVDVIWASRIRGEAGVTVIVQNAKILSAERQIDTSAKVGAPVPSTVTLLVSAEDSSKVQLAATAGALSLSLRGDTDPGKGVSGSSITVGQLYGGAPSEGEVRPSNTVSVRGPDGKIQEMVLEDGKLIPLAGLEGSKSATSEVTGDAR